MCLIVAWNSIDVLAKHCTTCVPWLEHRRFSALHAQTPLGAGAKFREQIMQAEKLELDGFAQAEMSAQRLTAGVVTYWWCLPATWIPARCCCRLVHCNAAGPVCNAESREENQKGFKVGDKCRDFLCCYHTSFGQGHG